MNKQRMVLGLAALLSLLLAALAFGLGRPRSCVDWSELRVVAFESDDWGLPGFAPRLDAWEGIDRQELAPGHFPPVYWNTTLEDSSMVGRMCRLMARHRGRDGLPAVFQPNYVMGSLEYSQKGADWVWLEHEFPALPAHYRRPGLMAAVNQGMRLGVWYPELHARYHYDPDLRKANTAASMVARRAAARGITLFPDSEGARELGSWRALDDLSRELEQSRAIFRRAFGREPASIIAPDYTWHPALEKLWQEQGLTIVQAKREQRNPGWGRGLPARVFKVLERRWAQVTRPRLSYLERNVRLEPVQSPDPEALVADCARDVRRAWQRGEPAVVETHRVNFAHLQPEVVEQGLSALGSLLDDLTRDPEAAPVFLVDREIAQLQTAGTSAVWRGRDLILRNGTHGRKLVGIGPVQDKDRRLFLVPPRTTLICSEDGSIRSLPF